MGCNCGKNKKASMWKYTSPEGKITTYETEVAAKAAKIKNKGGTYKRVV